MILGRSLEFYLFPRRPIPCSGDLIHCLEFTTLRIQQDSAYDTAPMFKERIHANEKKTHFVQHMMGTKSNWLWVHDRPTPKETLPLLLLTPPCPSSHPSVCWAYKCSDCWTVFPQLMNGLSWVTAVDSVPRVALAWKIQAKKWPAFSLVWGLRPWTCDPKNCYNLSDVTRILENLPTISLLFITFFMQALLIQHIKT